jgi:hypothetical protein
LRDCRATFCAPAEAIAAAPQVVHTLGQARRLRRAGKSQRRYGGADFVAGGAGVVGKVGWFYAVEQEAVPCAYAVHISKKRNENKFI